MAAGGYLGGAVFDAQDNGGRAGCGLIISEATAVDPLGMGWYRAPGIWNAEMVAGWRQVTPGVSYWAAMVFALAAYFIALPAMLFALVFLWRSSKAKALAAAVLLKGLTAHYLLRRTYKVKAGDTILFHAAAGGVARAPAR